MLSMNLKNVSVAEAQQYLQHVVAPRPICFASTIDKAGNVNLSPFSFFNLFSSNPPIVIFSPARRVRDNSTKHTLENVLEVPEVVVNIVDYDMVQQTSLASCEFPKGVNEFIKAGFTMQPSLMIKPPMVKESKVKLECRVVEVKPLGNEGGAGNLVICEVLQLHISKNLLNENGKIDQRKFKLVARLGGDWYCRVDEQNLFSVAKPNTKLGIGIDALPENVRNSKILTGNHLGSLANVHELPEIDTGFSDGRLDELHASYRGEARDFKNHEYVKELVDEGNLERAWQVLLLGSKCLSQKIQDIQ
jgi:flavin reductase (DIM6/NTAB) family NADH-FMN oxidoreductase RutF